MIDSLEISNKLRKGVKFSYEKVDDKNFRILTPHFSPETGQSTQAEVTFIRLQHLVDKKTQLSRELSACEGLILEAKKLGLLIPLTSIAAEPEMG